LQRFAVDVIGMTHREQLIVVDNGDHDGSD
jgi:hypothetical protein